MPEDTHGQVEWSLPIREPIRRMILSGFEDEVLLREEMEVWVDSAAAPGEPVLSGCSDMAACYCRCNLCAKCERQRKLPAATKKSSRRGKRRR